MDVAFWNSLPELPWLWGMETSRKYLLGEMASRVESGGGRSERHEHLPRGKRWPCWAGILRLIWRADAGSSSDQRTTGQVSRLGPVMDNPAGGSDTALALSLPSQFCDPHKSFMNLFSGQLLG